VSDELKTYPCEKTDCATPAAQHLTFTGRGRAEGWTRQTPYSHMNFCGEHAGDARHNFGGTLWGIGNPCTPECPNRKSVDVPITDYSINRLIN
jgi:hypothetical protein